MMPFHRFDAIPANGSDEFLALQMLPSADTLLPPYERIEIATKMFLALPPCASCGQNLSS